MPDHLRVGEQPQHRQRQNRGMMFGRGSPKFFNQAKDAQKKLSPKGCSAKRKGSSPKVDKSRASWNPGLEKALVDLLHEHNNPSFRGQNGWSSETWNKIVKEFREKHPYVTLTKVQIQEKKELKRDYRMLKEARKQSGAAWNDQRCMIEVEPALWNNIIISYPRAKKFHNKSFPLFDALGELYDGQTAEGSLNFTSTEPSQYPIYTQVDHVDDSNDTEINFPDFQDTIVHVGEDIGISSDQLDAGVDHEQNLERNNHAATKDKVEKEQKRRRQNGDVASVMERYLAMRTKQAEEEAATLARKRAEASIMDDFSIRRCISVVNIMGELLIDEKADAFEVFKSEQYREIFLSADEAIRLVWLRKRLSQCRPME